MNIGHTQRSPASQTCNKILPARQRATDTQVTKQGSPAGRKTSSEDLRCRPALGAGAGAANDVTTAPIGTSTPVLAPSAFRVDWRRVAPAAGARGSLLAAEAVAARAVLLVVAESGLAATGSLAEACAGFDAAAATVFSLFASLGAWGPAALLIFDLLPTFGSSILPLMHSQS